MKQISFSQAEFQRKKRRTRREVFLDEMERVMPWAEVFAVVEPHYPKGEPNPRNLAYMHRFECHLNGDHFSCIIAS
jgi:hypothetical protein